jgi:hypothetical protein
LFGADFAKSEVSTVRTGGAQWVQSVNQPTVPDGLTERWIGASAVVPFSVRLTETVYVLSTTVL